MGRNVTRGVMATAALLVACSGSSTRSTRYLLVPHPDDELEAWALTEDSDIYPVFVVLTRGELGCGLLNQYFEPATGEVEPGGGPGFEGRTCAENRVGSSLAFLAAAAKAQPHLAPMPSSMLSADGAPAVNGCVIPSTHLDVWAGQNMAIVYFDLGDGRLSECAVEWAMAQVRGLRGVALPQQPEQSVVASAFFNDTWTNCALDMHPDHKAVRDAVRATDFGTNAQRLLRTCSNDPQVAFTRRVHGYDLMSIDAQGRRVGAAQRYYGWLFPGALPTGDQRTSVFSEVEAFAAP